MLVTTHMKIALPSINLKMSQMYKKRRQRIVDKSKSQKGKLKWRRNLTLCQNRIRMVLTVSLPEASSQAANEQPEQTTPDNEAGAEDDGGDEIITFTASQLKVADPTTAHTPAFVSSAESNNL